ncbi:MAG: LamG domain-containing protein [bacterium]|nr:LamG domain-containing protein [bacterium]
MSKDAGFPGIMTIKPSGANFTDMPLMLFVRNDEKVFAYVSDRKKAQCVAADAIRDRWAHFAVTWDGARIRGYGNGVLTSDNPCAFDPALNGLPLWIGRTVGVGSPAYFKGELDDLSLYNKALDAGTVRKHYEARAGVSAQTQPTQKRGIIADYTFSSSGGGETVLMDESGNDNHGTIHGAQWVRGKQGFCLKFDGEDDYVDCGDKAILNIRDSVTVDAWVCPDRTAPVDTGIAGNSWGFLLTFYKNGCWWYISGGGNNVKAGLKLGIWQHVAGTFDGDIMNLYVNGKLTATKKSEAKLIGKAGNLTIGCLMSDPAAKDPAMRNNNFFSGMIGRVRVYNKALSLEEIQKLYKTEAGYYLDSSQFNKLRIMTYPYFEQGRVAAEVDYSSFISVPQNASINLRLSAANSNQHLQERVVTKLPEWGRVESIFSLAGLPPGDYLIRASLEGEQKTLYQVESAFHYAPSVPVKAPSPMEKTVPPMPPPLQPVAYKFELSNAGGFLVSVNGETYPFESWYSYPHGGENKLLVSQKPDSHSEDVLRVTTRKINKDQYSVIAKGKYYSINRQIRLFSGRIAVKDTISNTTSKDLGIIIHNHLNAAGKAFEDSYLAGSKSIGRKQNAYSPSVFLRKNGLGIGIIPVDDVYIVQCAVYYKDGLAGVSTDKFGLAPNASYTLEWSVYLNGSGDYFDFTNAFRKDEGRIGRIEGGFMFVNHSMQNRTLKLSPDLVRRTNLKYAALGCLSAATDDPAVSIEGIEFMDFPKEINVLKEKMTEMCASYPDLMGMFHVAHSLYVTNKPDEKFPDSKVVDRDGNQAIWPDTDYRYITKERQAEGWRWWIFYPTPGNSFHNALMRSVDVMMDQIGCRGVFEDGLLAGYMGQYTYDRWDGHTVNIDPETKTIQQKIGSVILLSQPSIVEYIRKINAKGGTVVASNSVITRTIAGEKLIIMRESPCSDAHLSQTPAVLGLPQACLKNETDLYRDVLSVLSSGNLYFYCNTYQMVEHASLPAQMYPITCEEVRSGYAQGPERIITAHSGVFGWPGSADLHFAYHYDGRGVPVPHAFLTTADSSGVRTQVDLVENESAVLKRIPVSVRTNQPVNIIVARYDNEGIRISLNSRGKVDIMVANGEFAIEPNTAYAVKMNDVGKEVISSTKGILSLALELEGELDVIVEERDSQ